MTVGISFAQNGGVSIGKGKELAHGKAILELVSDSKGLLIPRISTSNRLNMFSSADPTAVGLMVFDKDVNAFFYYTGDAWQKMGEGSSVIQVGDALPDVSASLKGEMYFLTTSDKLAVFDGTEWKFLGNSSVSDLESVLKNGNDAGGRVISNLGTPVNDTDAANKKYVDENAQLISEKNVANGYVGLGADKKVAAEYLPGITLNAVDVVANEAEQLALDAKMGHTVIRTDISKTYVHNGGTSKDMSDWSELLFTNSVTSVNGKTGNLSIVIDDIADLRNELNSKINSPEGLSNKMLMINASGDLVWTAPRNLSDVLNAGNDAEGKVITGLGTPVNDTDATNKKYVDERFAASGSGDMMKVVYDKNGDDKVDDAEKVNGLTVETAVPTAAVFTDNQTLSQVLTQGADADGNAIANLAAPTNDTDAANKKYVDEKALVADWNQTDENAADYIKNKPDLSETKRKIYYGTHASFATTTPLSEAEVIAFTSVDSQSGLLDVNTNSQAGYFTLVMPASWRKPDLKIDGDDTFLVFTSAQIIEIEKVQYTVWQTDVALPAGLNIKLK
ncbi:hypothetical protein DF185_09390 [Marinifilum breve]|uniref:Major tropism determinant N-terminal domain-containing protein n=2 Tax=Marinifilum breve TaxID=2184082 RepID=A0A2V3ZZF5_9BACT|nr:hypothetical protein DF185_09390 [Marinifilum breve]